MEKFNIEALGEFKANVFKKEFEKLIALYKETAPFIVAAGKDPRELLVNSVVKVASDGYGMSPNERKAGIAVHQHLFAKGDRLNMSMMTPAPTSEEVSNNVDTLSKTRLAFEKAASDNLKRIDHLKSSFTTLLENQKKMDISVENAQSIQVAVASKSVVEKGFEIGR